MLIGKTRAEIKGVLMNADAPGVKDPYYIIQGESGQNITIISPGTNGAEFNKTYGAFHKNQEVEIYTVVYGTGVLLLQRNDEEGEAKEIRVAGLKPGMIVEVPAGYGHCIANIGKTYLVVVDNGAKSAKANEIDQIKAKKGLCYYIVDKKGEVGFEANPNYRLHPQISTY